MPASKVQALVPAVHVLFWSVANKGNLRIPQWFRVITGIVQLAGAAALIWGYWAEDVIAWGAIWLGITMPGALFAHLRVKDSIGKTMPPVVFLLLIVILTVMKADGLTV